MTTKSLAVTFFGIASMIAACVDHDLSGDDPMSFDCSDEVSYSDDITPIINTNCAVSGCHNGSLGSDLDWRVPENIQEHAQDAKRRVMLPESHADHMPKDRPMLATDDIEKIACWADQNAPIDN